MTIAGISLFDLAERRLTWLDNRQQRLAQNIANADTPGWAPSDLAPFAADIGRVQGALLRTDPGHFGPSGVPARVSEAHIRNTSGERAPDGNAVSLNDQLARLAGTETAHDLATDIYRKYLGFFRLAIGR